MKKTTVTNSKRKSLVGMVLVAGLVISATGESIGKQIDRDGSSEKGPALSNERVRADASHLSLDERKRIIDDVGIRVERGIKAKYGRHPENPSDDEIARIIQDVEKLAESELESRYGHLSEDERESMKKSISLDFQRGMQSRRAAARVETRIEQLQGLPNGELEKKAQAGDPYAQYALGKRIRDKIGRRESGANRRELDDYRLLDYAGQLLLAAAETAIEKKMHSHFRDRVANQLTSWHRACQSFRAPILKDPEFCRRWKVVKRDLKCPIPDISEEQ